MAEIGIFMCASPTRVRSLPSFRPLPVSFARLPHLSATLSAILLTVLCICYSPLLLERCAQACDRWPACVRCGAASAAAPRASRATLSSHAVCEAERSAFGPQIAFAQAGGSSQSPSKNIILELRGGRPGGGFRRRRRHRRPLARVSTMCCVRAGEGAVARAMAARGRRGRVAWPCEVREGAPGLDAPGRRPYGRVRVHAGVLRALVCLSRVHVQYVGSGAANLG